MNPKALDILKRSEGLRLTAYRCSAGVPTIGFGHTGPDVRPEHVGKRKISANAAEALLLHDYEATEAGVLGACSLHPTENQLGAMVCLAFNIGMGWSGTKKAAGERDGFRQSSVLRAHNRGDVAAAAKAFALWNKATVDGKKVALPGLVTRRAAEAALYLTPDDGAEAVALPQSVEPEKPLSESRTVRAGTLAAAAPALGMIAEASRQVAEIRDSLGPWLPWVLIAAGVAAGAWVIWERFGQRERGEA